MRILGHDNMVVYDEDPLVSVSQLHAQLEPSSLDMDDVVSRFGAGGDVSSSVWGPAAWDVLHRLAGGPRWQYTRDLLEVWRELLPCERCRTHLAQHLEATPASTWGSTPQQTYKYTVSLHNAVNVSLGRPPRFDLSL
jgi:hypothetical protein